METIYEQTEYDRITAPIRKRYERISRERGVTVIPLAAGEQEPKHEPDQAGVVESAGRSRGGIQAWFDRSGEGDAGDE